MFLIDVLTLKNSLKWPNFMQRIENRWFKGLKIVLLCRLYDEKAMSMQLRIHHSRNSESTLRLFRTIDICLILSGKKNIPLGLTPFRALSLEHTHVCSVTIDTPNVKIKRLAVVVSSNYDNKTTGVIHWWHEGLDFMVTDRQDLDWKGSHHW